MKAKPEPDSDVETGAVSVGYTLQVRIRLVLANFSRMSVYILQYVVHSAICTISNMLYKSMKAASNSCRLAIRPSNIHGRKSVLCFETFNIK